MSSYSLVQGYQSFRGSWPEYWGSRILRNVDIHIPKYKYMAPHSRRQYLQILHDYFFSSSYYRVLNDRIFSKQWIGKNVEVTGCHLIQVTSSSSSSSSYFIQGHEWKIQIGKKGLHLILAPNINGSGSCIIARLINHQTFVGVSIILLHTLSNNVLQSILPFRYDGPLMCCMTYKCSSLVSAEC
jgi:hypothetical protein